MNITRCPRNIDSSKLQGYDDAIVSEPSTGGSKQVSSEPIACPPSDTKSTHEYESLEQSKEHYNNLTWIMYRRIMNARKSRDNDAILKDRRFRSSFNDRSDGNEKKKKKKRESTDGDEWKQEEDEIFHLELERNP